MVSITIQKLLSLFGITEIDIMIDSILTLFSEKRNCIVVENTPEQNCQLAVMDLFPVFKLAHYLTRIHNGL